MATPYKHPQTGMYYLRRKLPVDVRFAFDGRQLFKQSLNTKILADARREFIIANAELEKRITAARQNAQASPTFLARQWFTRKQGNQEIGARRFKILLMRLDAIVADERARLDPFYNNFPTSLDWDCLIDDDVALADAEIQRYGETSRPGTRWWTWRFSKRSKSVWYSAVEAEANCLLASHPTSVCPASDIVQAIVNELGTAFPVQLDASQEPDEWVSPVKTSYQPNMKLSKVFEKWMSQKGLSSKTIKEFGVFVADFTDFSRDPPIGKIDGSLIRAYRDEAKKLPSNLPRHIRSLLFTERLSWVKRQQKSEMKLIAPATLKKRIVAVQAMLSFAESSGIIESRPAVKVQIEGYKRLESGRRLFSTEEIGRYFSAPLFTSADQLIGRSTDAKHLTAAWISLLAFSIGCRLNEASQLLVNDIRDYDGIYCLIFTDEEHDTGEKSDDKKFKVSQKYQAIP